MNQIKGQLQTKRGKIIVGGILSVIIIVCVAFFYVYNENVKKEEALNAMQIIYKENSNLQEIEYGSELKIEDFIQEVVGGEVKEYPLIDTSKISEQTLKFTISKDKYSKEIEQKINVIDTKAPEITFESDGKEITVGDEFDIKSNITSVKDIVDGDIAFVENAKASNEAFTSEYNGLDKTTINAESKIQDKLISDFLIEDVNDSEDKILYLKNQYYIEGLVDTTTAGDYTIKIVAVDKNGLKSEKEFIVTVKEKPVAPKAPVNTGNNGGSTTGGGGNATATAPKGKDWMISYANGFIGQTGWNCQDFVDECLRAAGYLSPSQPNFAYGGTDIAWQSLAPGDVVATTSVFGQKHVRIITSYPTIDEYGTYRWSTIDGGAGASQLVEQSRFEYNPSNGGMSLDYIRRY